MSKMLDRIRAAQKRQEETNTSSSSSNENIFYNLTEGSHQIRLVGEWVTIHSHWIGNSQYTQVELFPDSAFSGEKKIKKIICCSDFDIDTELPKKEKTCVLCNLRNVWNKGLSFHVADTDSADYLGQLGAVVIVIHFKGKLIHRLGVAGIGVRLNGVDLLTGVYLLYLLNKGNVEVKSRRKVAGNDLSELVLYADITLVYHRKAVEEYYHHQHGYHRDKRPEADTLFVVIAVVCFSCEFCCCHCFSFRINRLCCSLNS